MFKDPDFLKKVKNQKVLILLSIPFVIYVLIFCYVPLFGWIMAFQKYKPKTGILHSEFVGLSNFKFLFTNANGMFINVIRNTVAMGLINLVLGTIFAIGFAILLSEFRFTTGKKVIQTISYLPHFLSWVIVTGILHDALSNSGIINEVLQNLGIVKDPIPFRSRNETECESHIKQKRRKDADLSLRRFLYAIIMFSVLPGKAITG
jgi:putative aldouronate transport system permease protein